MDAATIVAQLQHWLNAGRASRSPTPMPTAVFQELLAMSHESTEIHELVLALSIVGFTSATSWIDDRFPYARSLPKVWRDRVTQFAELDAKNSQKKVLGGSSA
jgi:hypothetical protein